MAKTRIFVCARDHKSFPGRGISVILDLTFLPGGTEFDSNFLGKMSKSRPMLRLPPAGLTFIGA